MAPLTALLFLLASPLIAASISPGSSEGRKQIVLLPGRALGATNRASVTEPADEMVSWQFELG